MRARLLKGASTVVGVPVQTKARTESVITLEFATVLTTRRVRRGQAAGLVFGRRWLRNLEPEGMWGHLSSVTLSLYIGE